MEKIIPLLGAHVSISGSLENAIARAETIGANCMQIFVKNNRQWSPPKISESQAQAFKAELRKSSIKTVVAHATYLINLCSQDPEVRRKSMLGLESELSACDMLGIKTLVLHPGSNPSSQTKESIKMISDCINEIYKNRDFNTIIAIETMAGQGSSIGGNFEEIANIISKISNKNKIGACLDTCHIFAAGYDIRTKEAYESTMDKFDETIGLKYLKAIHINDSKKDISSFVDRHEHIGAGKIGLNCFSFIMNDPRLTLIPKIIETPKDGKVCDENECDKRNIKTLIELIK